jgi:hypothetical protein
MLARRLDRGLRRQALAALRFGYDVRVGVMGHARCVPHLLGNLDRRLTFMDQKRAEGVA